MKTLIAILALFASLTVRAQIKTWGGNGNLLYPNMAPSTVVIDKGGTNTLTVNNANPANSGDFLLRMQQQGTNSLTINPFGGIRIADAARDPGSWYPGDNQNFTIGLNTALGDPDTFKFRSGVWGGGTEYTETEISSHFGDNSQFTTWYYDNALNFSSISDSVGPGGSSNHDVSSQGTGYNNLIRLTTDPSKARIEINDSVGTKTSLEPTIADGSTPYIFDTTVTHTSSSLLDLKNNGTNVVQVFPDGGMFVGKTAAEWFGGPPGGGIEMIYDTDVDVGSYPAIEGIILNGQSFFSGYSLQADSGDSTFYLDYGNTHSIFSINESNSYFSLSRGSTNLFLINPDEDTTSSSYNFNTSETHTSGNLLELSNNSTNKFTVNYDGAIKTGDPSGAAVDWKLGNKITGATVSLVTTNYVEVNINGSVVKLAIVQ